MWILENQTPFAAERAWVRDEHGAEVWLVAVKGTFAINPDGRTRLAEVQEPVALEPRFAGDPARSSLLHDTDLPDRKEATDVLVIGHAHAPRAEPVDAINVGLSLGPIRKVLRVTGDRVWEDRGRGLTPSRPRPFVAMPINYERAYGGLDPGAADPPGERVWDVRNPAGCGRATSASSALGRALPNVEDPRAPITVWNDAVVPVGFGPIAGHWAPRVGLAGTYDERWEQTRQPLVPEDFDPRFYHCAPMDQQIRGHLRGGEPVELRHLTPAGQLCFRLPRVTLSFKTCFSDGTHARHRALLHTVLIRPDGPTVTLVWHTRLACHHKVLKLQQTLIRSER